MSHKPDELLTLVAEYVDFAESALTKLAKEVLDPKAKVRNRGTVCVPAESAKDKKDHFPINDIDQARNALSQVGKYTSVPPWYSGSLESLKNTISRKVHAKYPTIGKETKKKAFVDSFDKLINKFAEEGRQLWDKNSHQWVTFPTDLGALFKIQPASVSRIQQNGQWVYSVKDNDKWHPLPADRLEYYIDANGTTSQPGVTSIPEVTITGTPPGKPANRFSQKVKDLQIKLRDVYKLTGADGKPLKDDGLMGPNTKFAIQSYKTEYNMPQATDAMAIYNIMNTKPEEHPGRYANTPGQPNNEIERKNPF